MGGVRKSGCLGILPLLCACGMATPAAAGRPWSVEAYFGPSTYKFIGAVFESGRYQASGAMLGIAGDGRLFYVGEGVSIAAEAEITEYGFGHLNTTFAFGLGFQAQNPFGLSHSRISIYTGPSYSLDPPHIAIGYGGVVYPAARVKFLNYVTLEYARALSDTSPWDGVIKVYHRSGAFGLYSSHDDDGLSVGLGVKYRF
ncbi:MAG TPA: hypothetical protein VG387_01030 [Rhizomicrobium sp.]|jgi:hypothetical protein|nr:hypothetical protein [Rhizomicrobium sp.]